ncbi:MULTISPECIES: hypothetical protein [Xanthomonas]|uniref:hypothetical protein n=1 Tax=Xanthomonas TaxID=338 RepID=UPI000E1E8968|nr:MULTISPECIES: hypothetical protein [Xanthomonas]
MTNVSCKERMAKPARVHEPARFNQTFYPYACVLFSDDCALRHAMGYVATSTRHTQSSRRQQRHRDAAMTVQRDGEGENR